MELTDLERTILQRCVAGDHPMLAVLRAQLPHVTVTKRELTGVGFYADLAVSLEAPRVVSSEDTLAISDVVANVPALKEGLGFVLFVKQGAMSLLECFTYGEDWPSALDDLVVRYVAEPRDLSGLR